MSVNDDENRIWRWQVETCIRRSHSMTQQRGFEQQSSNARVSENSKGTDGGNPAPSGFRLRAVLPPTVFLIFPDLLTLQTASAVLPGLFWGFSSFFAGFWLHGFIESSWRVSGAGRLGPGTGELQHPTERDPLRRVGSQGQWLRVEAATRGA